MKTLLRIVGTGLAVAAGIAMYDLAVPSGFVSQTLPLLVILLGQFAMGGALGWLTRSWRAVAMLPLAYVAGFVAASMSAGPSAGADQFAILAGGNLLLATVFFLALLCSLLAAGSAAGATGGIRMEQHWAVRRRQIRAVRAFAAASIQPSASQLPVAEQSSRVAMPAEHELAPVGR